MMIGLICYVAACELAYIIMNNCYNKGRTALPTPKKWVFYLLQFTWGLPLNIVGLVVGLVLFCCGHFPKKYGWGYCFELDVDFGVEMGVLFIAPPGSAHTKKHELGHGIQNIYLGPLMIGTVCIPSMIRFWIRKLKKKKGKALKGEYDSIWFEGQATKSGNEFMKKMSDE